jgi:chitodextrinase
MRRDLLFAIALSAALLVPEIADAQGKGHHNKTPPPPADTTAPTVPGGLAASGLTTTSVTLSWIASTDNVGVAGYRIYSSGALIASTSTTSLSIGGLVGGTSYAFTVAAFDAAGNVSPASSPVSVTTPTPAPVAQILWRADMETGDLSQWSDQTNSGNAYSDAVTAFSAGIPPKSGNWVMRQTVSGTGGTRMARFPEIDQLTKAGTTYYTSWWDYYPAKITFLAGDMFNFWQVGSYDASGVPNPIWGLFLNGSDSTLILAWSPAGNGPAEGPHAGEFAQRRAYSSSVAVPVGQWTFFEIMITPSADFTGALKVWMNGQLVFDQSQIKTRFPDSALGGFTYATHDGYGSNLSPNPTRHYVDDVTISLGRLYAP